MEHSSNPATEKKRKKQLEVAEYILRAVNFYNTYIKMADYSPDEAFRICTHDVLRSVLAYSACAEVGGTQLSNTVDYIRFVIIGYVSHCGVASKEQIDEYIALAISAGDEDDIISLLDRIEMEVASKN